MNTWAKRHEASFIANSLSDLVVNVVVLKIVLMNFSLPFKFIAQAFGIAAGTIMNFPMEKMMVFKPKRQES